MLPIIIAYKDFHLAELRLKELMGDNGIYKHALIEIKPLKEEITIGQIRELKRDLSTAQKNNRMIVFYDFDKSSVETQNSLLKTIEEKTEVNLFVFLVENLEKILPTIKSRTKIINLNNLSDRLVVSPETIKLIEEIKESSSLGFLAKKELLVTKKDQYVKLSNELLIYFKNCMRKNTADVGRVVNIIKKILYLANLLENNNLNPQLTLDNLLIFIWKSYNMK